MAVIKPFAALRPEAELARKICELPYDVMSSEEAREMAAGNALSFLHVSKPEIDLAPGTDLYSPQREGIGAQRVVGGREGKRQRDDQRQAPPNAHGVSLGIQ